MSLTELQKPARGNGDGLAAGAGRSEDRPLLNSGTLTCLVALAILPLAGAAVDTTERSDAFEPKPSKQERVDKERTDLGEARPAADGKVEFVAVPAAEAKVQTPAMREKRPAPIEMAARSFQSRQPEPARIATSRAAPAKFDRKLVPPTVARIQDGMTEAGQVKTAKVKTNAKPSVLERINRFVFRRNEPAPASTPAGGENKPAEGAARPAESSSP